MIERRRAPTSPTYAEATRIGWTILWRGVGSVILVLTLVNAFIIYSLPELTRTGPSLIATLFPIILTALFGTFIIMPWVVRYLCTTSYTGFQLQLVHEIKQRENQRPET